MPCCDDENDAVWEVEISQQKPTVLGPKIRTNDCGLRPPFREDSAGDFDHGWGMTVRYTHTRPKSIRRQFEEALRVGPQSLELAEQWYNRDQV